MGLPKIIQYASYKCRENNFQEKNDALCKINNNKIKKKINYNHKCIKNNINCKKRDVCDTKIKINNQTIIIVKNKKKSFNVLTYINTRS